MTFVEHFEKKEKIAKLCDPKTDPLAEPGVRTYFGERFSKVKHGLARMEFNVGAAKADITLKRSEEWITEYRKRDFPPREDDGYPTEIDQWRLVRMTVQIETGETQIAWFWPSEEVLVLNLKVGEYFTLRIPNENISGEGKVVAIDPAPFLPRKGEKNGLMFLPGKGGGKTKISESQVGDYAMTYTDEERGLEPQPDDGEVELVVRQRIQFRLEKEDGEEVTGALLRTTEWV